MTCGAMAGSVTPLSSRGPSMPRSRATRKNTLGMFATAAVVESTIGKNAAMKIRKIAGGSPMPSQRIANGIQASGDRLRKKLTSGRKAARARAECPSSRPAGTPRTTASRNPAETRNSDAIASFTSRPLLNSNHTPRATSQGCGKSDGGKSRADDTAAHSRTSTAGVTSASRAARVFEAG